MFLSHWIGGEGSSHGTSVDIVKEEKVIVRSWDLLSREARSRLDECYFQRPQEPPCPQRVRGS